VTRALVVQHVAIEGPYAIADALRRGDVTIDVRLAGSDPLPASIDGFDALVVMGGPMSAYDDHDFPTRRDELTLLASAVAAGVPTLGVCLGAQLLAAAVGGAAVPGEAGLEIGWGPVWLVPEAKDDPLLADLDGELTVLHWHGDTVVLPSDAVLLASSDRYANQAFRVAPRAWGLQFHVEVTLAAVVGYVEAFGGDTAIAEQAPRHLAALEHTRDEILDRFAALVIG